MFSLFKYAYDMALIVLLQAGEMDSTRISRGHKTLFELCHLSTRDKYG